MLPNWSSAASKLVLLQPSTAAAEQVFFPSLLNAISTIQQSSLEEYVETSYASVYQTLIQAID